MSAPDLSRISRRPRRVSVTLANKAYEELVKLSDLHGRSASNLAAYLLERGLEDFERRHAVRHASGGHTPPAKP